MPFTFIWSSRASVFLVATGVFADCACLTSEKRMTIGLELNLIHLCIHSISRAIINYPPNILLDKLNKVEPLPASDITGELCPKHNIQKQTLPHPSTLVAIPSLPRPIAQPTDVEPSHPPLTPSSARIGIRIKQYPFPAGKCPSSRLSIGSHSSPTLFILWLDKTCW